MTDLGEGIGGDIGGLGSCAVASLTTAIVLILALVGIVASLV